MYDGLEDAFADVVGKARRGQELTCAQVASGAGLGVCDLERIEAGEWVPDAAASDRLARTLGLDPAKLRRSAARGFFPAEPEGRRAALARVRMLVLGTEFRMNAYLVACRQTGKAAIVDPGFQAERILAAVREMDVDVDQVWLTHGHGDHVGAVAPVLEATGATAAIGGDDLVLAGAAGARIAARLVPGTEVGVGHLRLRVATTSGHTPGGVSLVHDEFAFVGDALFAGSLGGTRRRVDYEGQRAKVRSALLSLPAATVLYPGHGPATTVAEERDHNPFFT